MDKYQKRYLEHIARKKARMGYEQEEGRCTPSSDVLIALLRARHSQRTFCNVPLASWQLGHIYDAIRVAPSSCNRQAICVLPVLYQDQGQRALLETYLVGGRNWISGASTILLLFADMLAYKSPAEREFMPWMDAAFVAANAYIAAEAMGVGCCFVNPNIRDKDKRAFHVQFNPRTLRLRFCGAIALGNYGSRDPQAPKRAHGEIFYSDEEDE